MNILIDLDIDYSGKYNLKYFKQLGKLKDFIDSQYKYWEIYQNLECPFSNDIIKCDLPLSTVVILFPHPIIPSKNKKPQSNIAQSYADKMVSYFEINRYRHHELGQSYLYYPKNLVGVIPFWQASKQELALLSDVVITGLDVLNEIRMELASCTAIINMAMGRK